MNYRLLFNYPNRRRKILLGVTYICLLVCLQYIFFTVFAPQIKSITQLKLNRLKYFSELILDISDQALIENKLLNQGAFLYGKPNKQPELLSRDDLLTKVRQNKNVERIIKFDKQNIKFEYFLDREVYLPVYFIKPHDLRYLLERMDVKLKTGRLPLPRSNELVMDWRAAVNKGIQIGDKIGYFADKKEYMLFGEYKVVGLLEGDTYFSCGLLTEQVLRQDQIKKRLAVYKENKRKSVQEFLDTLPQALTVITYDLIKRYQSARNNLSKESRRFIVLTNIFGLIIIILAVLVTSLSQLYFFQQPKEWKLLYALGYSRRKISQKIALEITIINLLGFSLGLLISMLVVIGINSLLLPQQGYTLEVCNLQIILKAACIPLFGSSFAILLLSRRIKNLSPLDILERSR